ncbi:MAG: tetratricopeptide repeat protein [Candidatus Hermodarchaeota archaeon]
MSDEDKLIEKARLLLENEKFEKAIELLEDLYKKHPKHDYKKEFIDALFAYGGYLNDDYVLEYEKSIKFFKRIIDIDPENYRAYYNLGIAYFNLERFNEALKTFKIATSLKPDYKHCHYNIGLVYEAMGNLEKAIKAYEKALRIDPNFIYAMHALKAVKLNLDETEDLSRQSQDKNDYIQKLISMIKISNRIRLDMIQEILILNRESLLNIVINWGKKEYCEIDGDYLIINKQKLALFIEDLSHGVNGV